MASLDQFVQTDRPSLADFQVEGPLYPISSQPSNRNLAAYTAALSGSPESVSATYLQVAGDLDRDGQSRAGEAIQQEARRRSYGQARQGMMDVLADPTVDDETKRIAAVEFLDETNPRYNVRNTASFESLSEDSQGESVEAEDVRISIADALEEVNDYKLWQQSVITTEANRRNPSLARSMYNFAELMVPFAEAAQVGTIKEKMEVDPGGAIMDMVFFGSAKMDVRNAIRSLAPEDRRRAVENLVDIVNNSSALGLPDDNHMAAMHQLRSFLEDGYYDSFDKWVDNVVGVLDVVMLGGAVRGGVRTLRGTRPLEGLEGDFIPGQGPRQPSPSDSPQIQREALQGEYEDVTRQAVRSDVQPASLSQNYKDTNPNKARAAHEAAAADESGEAARALYGTNRTEAVANDILPEAPRSTGRVRAKTPRPEETYIRAVVEPDPNVQRIANRDGGYYYWPAERVAAQARVVNDFHGATGLTPRPEMSTISMDGTRVNVDMVYGGMDSGWSNAEEAVELTKFSLRHYGVVDDNITLLQRQGSDYVPVQMQDIPEGSTDFLVQVKQESRMTAQNLETMEEADVLRNLFDRFPLFAGNSQGSFQRHLLDAHSMLHPNITLGANVAVDRQASLEKNLLDQLARFSDVYTKLPKDRQQLVENVIKEANHNSRAPNYNKLVADGFTREEIQSLRNWKEFWDTQYWLENRDLSRSLQQRGYRVFEDAENGTRIFARPLARQRAGDVHRAYDASTGEIVSLTPEARKALYDEGGTLATMRNPIRVGDEASEVIISRETAGGGYLRALNDNDQVLQYREGYYQVNYTGNNFVDKIVRDSKGNELYRQAVAVAGSMRDATLTAERLKKTNGEDYVPREGRDKMSMGSDDYWNIQHATGRTAQRVRGERLEDATSSMNMGADHSLIMGPAEAGLHAARSVSRRVAMRDYMEATKERFIRQYGNMLPTDRYGRPVWPNRISDITKKEGTLRDKDIADARTMYEYINSLEVGYINAIDESFKAGLRGVADILGKAGTGRGERAFHYMADQRGPMQFGRNTAFTLYLALNPIRQMIVQGHQAVQLTANFPGYVATRLAPDTAAMMAMKLDSTPKEMTALATGRSLDELKRMTQAFEDSGLAAAIDKQNLIKGSLTEAAENARFTGGIGGKVAAPINLSRKIGFDAGEHINMLTSWLAHYNRQLEKTGKSWDKLSSTDWDEISARARSYTYNMNRAGEMPYNENWMGLHMQFAQVPHKAALQMLTDRTLTGGERARLAGFNAMMYGVPSASVMYPWVEKQLPDEGELREVILQGLEGYTFNKFLTLTTGQETRIDYTGLAAADMTGLYELIASLATTDMGEIIAAAPAGSLFFGENPRVTNFAKNVARWGHLIDDIEDPVTMTRMAKEMASLSSGMSNFFKARYAVKTGQKLNSMGNVSDPTVTTPEGVAAMFGFGTLAEAQRRYVSMEIYEQTTAFRDDVNEYYRVLKRHLTAEGVDQSSREWQERVITDANRVWEESTAAQGIIYQNMARDARRGDDSMWRSVIEANELDNETRRRFFRTMPDEELSKEGLRIMDWLDRYEDE